jgi:UDP-N-acetylmuramate--alanine ligase
MIAWVLEQAGYDPNVVNGAPLRSWIGPRTIGNARRGRSGLWVIEADESDRSLLRFRPDYAVITNASTDHFSARETRELFRRFAAQVKGPIVGGVRGPRFSGKGDPCLGRRGSSFRLAGDRIEVRLPGRHNAANALLAARLCLRLGVGQRDIRRGLRSFAGLARRLEEAGSARGVSVFDDYAHNPAKIQAAWTAVRPRAGRVLAVWRPHGYGPLRAMMAELEEAFAGLMGPADRLFVLPVYDAGGTANRSVRADELAARLAARSRAAAMVADYAQAARRVAAEASRGDVVLVMGARDPGLPRLARRIVHVLRRRQGEQART